MPLYEVNEKQHKKSHKPTLIQRRKKEEKKTESEHISAVDTHIMSELQLNETLKKSHTTTI